MGRLLNPGYLDKWVLIRSPVRLGARFAASAFHLAITILGEIKAYYPPAHDGESRAISKIRLRFLLILIATTIYGLIGATLLDGFAKAEGIVADAIIETYRDRRLVFYHMKFVLQV